MREKFLKYTYFIFIDICINTHCKCFSIVTKLITLICNKSTITNSKNDSIEIYEKYCQAVSASEHIVGKMYIITVL